MNFLKKTKYKISHTSFCFLYCALSYIIYNLLNYDKTAQWFYIKDGIDYIGLFSFFAVGFCAFFAVFLLLCYRHTTKFFAILFVILSTIAVYFIKKYNVAIDRSMLMNAIYTDKSEVHSLLSWRMIPYLLFLTLVPILVIWRAEIVFKKNYLLSSLKLIVITLIAGVIFIYAGFDSIHRAANLSRKYIIHSLVPINYIRSIGSVVQISLKPYFVSHKKIPEISGQVMAKKNLIVVLAIGETARQKNFSLYGYQKNNTNPILSKDKKIHVLNGKARIGSTLYALPEILKKNDVPLTNVTAKLGIDTACYVNYTLYDNCTVPGEVLVSNCGHGGVCYDEDVLPLLENNLKSYVSGPSLVVLHLGGGSHGPSYHERYPKEFQHFKPMCVDADVVNQCSLEQLYNSYDNTILYTDYVLAKIIEKLDKSKLPYVFIYLSDHGESLMEDGKIFHGMPPGIDLPKEQAQIPLLVKASIPIVIKSRKEYSQQDIFDTVLDLLVVESKIHDKDRGFIVRKDD